MLLRTPKFWESINTASLLLFPFSLVYAAVSALKYNSVKPTDTGLPVICIGNLTAGGSGKTPVAIEVAKLLAKHGQKPFFLTRGYGSKTTSPTLVDLQNHTPENVGDEALLLANNFPTVVSPNRVSGAELCKKLGATIIVMDDGLQNPSLHKTISIAVIDGGYGFGNGFVFPAGALRESIGSGLKKINAAIIIGDDSHGVQNELSGIKTISAKFTPTGTPEHHTGRQLLAFAGIGRPQKFFDTLKEAGLDVVRTKCFPDHFAYQSSHIKELVNEAEGSNLMLVTTEKDFVKIPQEFRSKITPFPVKVSFENESELENLLITRFAKKTA